MIGLYGLWFGIKPATEILLKDNWPKSQYTNIPRKLPEGTKYYTVYAEAKNVYFKLRFIVVQRLTIASTSWNDSRDSDLPLKI